MIFCNVGIMLRLSVCTCGEHYESPIRRGRGSDMQSGIKVSGVQACAALIGMKTLSRECALESADTSDIFLFFLLVKIASLMP